MVVIDPSALAKYLLREESWEKVREVLEKNRVYSLNCAITEVANTIWRKVVIYKMETVEVAMKRVQLLQKLISNKVIELENEVKYLGKAVEIAFKNNISILEALYIAQAMELKIPLLTSSRKQFEIALKLGVNVNLIE